MEFLSALVHKKSECVYNACVSAVRVLRKTHICFSRSCSSLASKKLRELTFVEYLPGANYITDIISFSVHNEVK